MSGAKTEQANLRGKMLIEGPPEMAAQEQGICEMGATLPGAHWFKHVYCMLTTEEILLMKSTFQMRKLRHRVERLQGLVRWALEPR